MKSSIPLILLERRLELDPPFSRHAEFSKEQDRWDILCLPESKCKIRTAHSLGADGTTAFVSEFGELVAFRKILSYERPQAALVEPPIAYKQHKEDEVNDILEGRLPGLGLRLEDREQCRDHKIDYVHDRWPRVSYRGSKLSVRENQRKMLYPKSQYIPQILNTKSIEDLGSPRQPPGLPIETIGDLDIKVQFFIHHGVVAQQYLVSNPTHDPRTCNFKLDLGFGARLSNLNSGQEKDQPDLTQSGIFSSAGGYGARFWAGDRRGQVQIDVVLFQDGRSVMLHLSNAELVQSDIVGDEATGRYEGFGNQRAARASSPYSLHTIIVGPGDTREITALYSLEKCIPTERAKQAIQPAGVELANRQPATVDGYHDVRLMRHRSELGENALFNQSKDKSTYTKPGATENNRSSGIDSADEVLLSNANGSKLSKSLEVEDKHDAASILVVGLEGKHFLSPSPQYIDVSMLLKDSHRGKWTLAATPTNRLLRRHLQQLLSVNSVSIPGPVGIPSAILLCEASFTCNTVPVWGSLCMFRFLLEMYGFLDQRDVTEPKLRDHIQAQIKDTCERHLDWIFDVSQDSQRGWTRDCDLDGSYSDFAKGVWYDGAVHIIKLYEFQIVFKGLRDQLYVHKKLSKHLGSWFHNLGDCQDPKSGMWASTVLDIYVVWLDPQYRQDETLQLPEYKLCDLIVLWKAFSCAFKLVQDLDLLLSGRSLGASETTILEAQQNCDLLNTSLPINWRQTFSTSRLRTNIMDKFTYDHTLIPKELTFCADEAAWHDETLIGEKHPKQGDSSKIQSLSARSARDETNSNIMRRKRILAFSWAGNDKPRYLWSSSASPIFEAINAGFFNDEYSEGVWKGTVEAQKEHRYMSWEKLSRYNLALRAAMFGQNLDVNADQLHAKVKNSLLKCLYSNGTIPTRLDLSTRQPTRVRWDTDNSTPTYELPLLLLQNELKRLDLAKYEYG